MSQESSIPDLIDCLRNAKRRFLGPDWKRRIECAELLAEQRAEEAVSEFVAVIDEKENTNLCRTCVQGLGLIGNAEGIQGLARLLTLPDRQDVHAEAVLALTQIETEEAGHALVEASADPATRPALVDGLRHEMRKAARVMIPDWERRAMAAEALGKLRATEAVDDMVEGLSKHKESRLWAATIPALTLIGDERAAEGLVSSWQWADETQSAAIRESLRSLGTERTDQPLIDGLGHEAPAVREQAWELLAETGILTRLVAALEEPSEEVHTRARAQAVQIGERAVTDLFEALHHDAGQVRRLAASALVDIGGEDVEPLRSVLALWGQVAETPRATVVAPDGSGDFVTVQEAVDEALPGGIIRMARGEHRLEGSLRIEKPLALLGVRLAASRIVGEASEILVRFSGNGPFCAVDIHFENTGSEAASVVEVADGEVGFYGCHFTGGSVGDEGVVERMAGIAELADGEVSFEDMVGPVLPHVPEDPIGGDGLRLLASCRGTVYQCTCSKNAKAGIAAMGQATVTLKNTVCLENWAGVLIRESAGGMILGNHCDGNQLHGIQIIGQAKPEVRDNTCDRNGKAGILADGEAQPILTANSCGSNKVGIAFGGKAAGSARQNKCLENWLAGVVVQDNAQASLQENLCQGNVASGIAYYDETTGSASQNQCIGNGTNGIKVAGSSSPSLQANTCNGNSIVGIAVVEKAQPTLEGNTCDENKAYGIVVTGSAQPTLNGNQCRRNDEIGLFYEGESAGTATGNELSENKGNGIQVQRQAQPTLKQNTCQKNEGVGLAYYDSAGGQAFQNRCLSNGVGILVADEAQPNLVENACKGSQHHGIVCGSLLAVNITGNECSSNRRSGIMIGEKSQPEVVGNVCRQNEEQGIHVAEQAAGQIRENECVSNGQNGIVVVDEAQPILEKNDCKRNKGAGIAYGHSAAGVAKRNRCRNNEEYGIFLLGNWADPELIDNDCRGNKIAQIYRQRD